MAKKLVFTLILSLYLCFPTIQSIKILNNNNILNDETNQPQPDSFPFPPPSARAQPQPRRPLQLTSAPPPQPDGKSHHPRRPANCSVATVLYDSCNPKHPKANKKEASPEEKEFFPQSMSSGFMNDAAGCCLGFAMFSNDCRPAIKDLSFAKQKIYSNLRNGCNNPY